MQLKLQEVDRERGAIAVVIAILGSTVLFGVATLAVDLGDTMSRARQINDSVDLAALAGADALPDASAARAAALTALCAAPGADRFGWPADTCTSTGWTTDGDSSNGEITVFGPDSNGNGFHDDGVAVSLPDGSTRTGSTDDERLGIASSLAGTAIRVVPPKATIDFRFGGAVGVNNATVQRASTAAAGIPTGLGSVPFYLLPNDLTQRRLICWRLTIQSVNGCGARSRGYLAEPRADSTGRLAVTDNVSLGLDHGLAPWTAIPYPPNAPAVAGGACNTQAGVSLLSPTPLANCVQMQLTIDGSTLNAIRDGFFGSDATTGRLYRTDDCPGDSNAAGSAGDYSGFDGNSLFQQAFLDPSKGATVQQLHDYVTSSTMPIPIQLRGALTSAIFRCPRLVIMPVLTPAGRRFSTSGNYPVTELRYVWLGSTTISNGFIFSGDGEQLRGVQGWVLDPALFPPQVAKSPGWWPVATPNLASGLPRQVHLVHDSDVRLPATP